MLVGNGKGIAVEATRIPAPQFSKSFSGATTRLRRCEGAVPVAEQDIERRGCGQRGAGDCVEDCKIRVAVTIKITCGKRLFAGCGEICGNGNHRTEDAVPDTEIEVEMVGVVASDDVSVAVKIEVGGGHEATERARIIGCIGSESAISITERDRDAKITGDGNIEDAVLVKISGG